MTTFELKLELAKLLPNKLFIGVYSPFCIYKEEQIVFHNLPKKVEVIETEWSQICDWIVETLTQEELEKYDAELFNLDYRPYTGITADWKQRGKCLLAAKGVK